MVRDDAPAREARPAPEESSRERLIDAWRSARAEFETADDALRSLSKSCAASGRAFSLASAHAIARRIRKLQERRAEARARLLSVVLALADARRRSPGERR
jgi:hypothetical protein